LPRLSLLDGTIEYEDTGGRGPILVFVHGLIMDSSAWRNVVAHLGADHRCVTPTLPLGAHRAPMRPEADLSLRGLVNILAEFIERLDLKDVTLIMNDWGGPLLLAADRHEPVRRLVVTSCEAFDNIPPGLPGRFAAISALLPGGIYLAAQSLRVSALRQMPFTFGWMAKRLPPSEIFDRWTLGCLTDRGVRRDLRKYSLNPNLRSELRSATERLRAFDRPTLIVWASEDRVMPLNHGRQLASIIPNARLVELTDSYTLIPEDQPAELARLVRQFMNESASRW